MICRIASIKLSWTTMDTLKCSDATLHMTDCSLEEVYCSHKSRCCGLHGEAAENYEMIGKISCKQTLLISGGTGVWVLD